MGNQTLNPPSATTIALGELFERFGQRLGLQPEDVDTDPDKLEIMLQSGEDYADIVGHLNLIRPQSIQVLGETELDYFASLGKNSHDDSLITTFSPLCCLVIIADGRPIPEAFAKQARQSQTPLISAYASSNQVVNTLRHFIQKQLAAHNVMHGVFLEVLGAGVLLSGESAVGKSELALELISRGHRLVADDAPEFIRSNPESITGKCPPMLRDFIEVRGLGVLNIRAMYGDRAVLEEKQLALIINLTDIDVFIGTPEERIYGIRDSRNVLDVEIPQLTLPVAAGRNLAVLVEAAVSNHILYDSGYNAADDFITRQEQAIQKQNTPKQS